MWIMGRLDLATARFNRPFPLVGQCIDMLLSSPINALDKASPPTCSACPAVCCQLKVLLIAGDDPPEHFIDLDDDGHQIMGKSDDGWCVALDRDAMRCSIYEQRPFVCREFAMGGFDCIDERENWRRIAISLR
jgi:Fe-S-cluster containining protein